MKTDRFSVQMSYLVAGASLLGLLAVGCNKQPSVTETPMVAPPAAALPMAGGEATSVAPAPVGAALPPAPNPIAYAPQQTNKRYGYIDRAYSMGQAFADTPPDYAVDYQGTRPWIWRTGNGAYRIVERLPQGERYYYYEPGQDRPFFVQDPDYGYAYDNGALAAVYGPGGVELADALAARRAQEASRYMYRAEQLYRASQYEQRQSAYASEWAMRRDNIRAQEAMWQQEQASNAQWRSWHDAHLAQEQQQWRQERDQRAAYAAAIGITGAVTANGSRTTAQPNPAEVAQRQASYFSNWKTSRAQAPVSTTVASRALPSVTPQTQTLPSPEKPASPGTQLAAAQQMRTATTQAKVGQVKAAADNTTQAKAGDAQRREAAVAQAKATQAQRAERLAAQAQQREAAAAHVKAAQAQHAQQLTAEAKQHEAVAAQAKTAQAKNAEAQAAKAKLADAKVVQKQATRAQHAQEIAAQAKEREAAAAQSKAAQAKAAQAKAVQAKDVGTKAAKAKAAHVTEVRAKQAEAKAGKGELKSTGKRPANEARGRRPNDRQSDNPQ